MKELRNYVGRIYVCNFVANKHNYKIVRKVIYQNYGLLVVNKVTYRDGKEYTNNTNKMTLERLNYGLNTGYFREIK